MLDQRQRPTLYKCYANGLWLLGIISMLSDSFQIKYRILEIKLFVTKSDGKLP